MNKEKLKIDAISKQYHNIFESHRRVNTRNNVELKIKLTPNDERPAYIQSFPVHINIKGELIV